MELYIKYQGKKVNTGNRESTKHIIIHNPNVSVVVSC